MVDDRHHGPSASQSGNGGDALYNRAAPRSPGEAIKPTAAPPPPPRTRLRRRNGGFLSALSAFLTLLLIGVVAVGSVVYFGRQEFYARGPLKETQIVTVKGGNQTVAEALQREGVIDHALIFVMGLHALGANNSIKAGEYAFQAGASMKDVMDTLVAGKSVLHSITIPEGLTSDQIVARLLANDLLTGEIKPIPLEGSLLPETYMVPRGTTRQAVIDRMAAEHRKVVAEAWEARAKNLPIKSPEELVVLASIVEKETGVPEERARVAAVFTNRLKQGMKLQSDPTIVYGIVAGKGTLGRGIRKSEITEATPYNTYVISGLPAGPIANPGRASLVAAAKPAAVDDIYFVADGTGGHQFAKSLDEHNRNVRAWRKIEAGRTASQSFDRVDEEDSVDDEAGRRSELLDSESGTKGLAKAFDASEGTKLDPLKNKTYDLTSPKTVPQLRSVQ
ncbi:endolytic transglycosylase MltG [Pseudochelatococcus sp. G4_1912]|uniref:endolytic transglycosylase MltG n=1 Tax=Pseudochelatococcus sp. G4_1912 TaxID=3114288 RepID=UPI0039C748C4